MAHLRIVLFLFFGAKYLVTSEAQSFRAARSLATSMYRFMPMPKKKERRGANLSTSKPACWAARMYSIPSAMVKASSSLASAPASCMWYPEMEIELYFGMKSVVYPKMSEMMRMEGVVG